ncbi:MAG TPA: nitrate reductase [Bacteroidetes bacterium]|nr:nitrate reductase [Bacteroidota bacterium]HEX05467.1 nitrate reductase [Bacteroidota bacterium]
MKISNAVRILTGAAILSLVLLIAVSFAVDCKNCQIGDDELGIRKGTLMNEELVVPASSDALPEAGESETITRAFENSPPNIPHSIADFLPITLDDNSCIDCHHPDAAADFGATSVPASHLYDIRSGEQTDGELNGANYNCVMCHTPMTDAVPVIENSFEADFRNADDSSSSNLLDILNEGVE